MPPSRLVTLTLSVCLVASSAFAQTKPAPQQAPMLPKTVTVNGGNTPLRSGPGITNPPVVTVGTGTVLEVVGRDGDWYRVVVSADMVSDPNAPKTAFVLARLVTPVPGGGTVIAQPIVASQPAVTAAPPAPQTEQRRVEPPPPPPTPTSSMGNSQGAPRASTRMSSGDAPAPATIMRRGDFSVGYMFLHDSPVNVPAGFVLNDAWRLGSAPADFVAEFSLAHTTEIGLGATYRTFAVGFRGDTSSRYGQRVSAQYGVVTGWLTGTLSQVGSGTGFLVKPTFGAEISLAKNISLRPQFDYLFTHFGNGVGWITNTWAVEINAVFPLWKAKQ